MHQGVSEPNGCYGAEAARNGKRDPISYVQCHGDSSRFQIGAQCHHGNICEYVHRYAGGNRIFDCFLVNDAWYEVKVNQVNLHRKCTNIYMYAVRPQNE